MANTTIVRVIPSPSPSTVRMLMGVISALAPDTWEGMPSFEERYAYAEALLGGTPGGGPTGEPEPF